MIVAVLHVFFAISDMLADLARVSSRHLEKMFYSTLLTNETYSKARDRST